MQGWETWPFTGEAVPRPLEPPVDHDPPRAGEGGVDCRRCGLPDEAYLWTDANWRLAPLAGPSGLPVVVLLETRAHLDFQELPPELASELGPLLVRVQRACYAVGDIANVHVCRWGDGGEHLHWWFMARPARMPQLTGSFAAVWDDVLPLTPEDVWRENNAIVVRELGSA